MSDEDSEQEIEHEALPEDTGEELEPESPRTVPLEALEAERRKRQDVEYRLRQYEEQQQDPEEEDSIITAKELKAYRQEIAREIREEAFLDAHPGTVKKIEKHLPEILERKPWLKEAISRSPNRWREAAEIVDKYMEVGKEKSREAANAKLQENLKKPQSPQSVAKNANLSKADYLKSIAGTPEFREYRKQMLSGKR